jgi:hypothetical protein
MCGLQQTRQHVLGHRRMGHESAHIAALGDGAVDG